MAFARSKTCVLIQLSVLLVSGLAALGTPISPAPSPAHHYHHHHHQHHHILSPNFSPAPSPAHHHHHHHILSPNLSPAPSPAHHHHRHHHSLTPSASPALAPAPTPSHTPGHHHHHHHHAHPPSHAPVESPMHPPTVSPSQPPMQPPMHPPPYPPHAPMQRSFVAVQGVVYCKSCKYSGSNSLVGATPVLGANVKLACNNSNKKPTIEQAKTDKNGYFFINAPKTVTSYAFHKCSVTLISSPQANCSQPTDLHGGMKGAILRPEKPFVANKLPFVLYTVGPLAFAPKCH